MLKKVFNVQLSPEMQTRLEERIFYVLTGRAVIASFVYLTIFVSIGLFTPVFYNFPRLAAIFGLVLALCGVARCYLAYYFKSEDIVPGPIARAMYFGSVLTNSLTWGLFCGYSLMEYQIGITSLIVLFPTAGVAGGSVLSLAPFQRLITAHMMLLLGPSIVVLLSQSHMREAKGYAVLTTVFLIYCLMQSRYICSAVKLGIYNAILLEDFQQKEKIERLKGEDFSKHFAKKAA